MMCQGCFSTVCHILKGCHLNKCLLGAAVAVLVLAYSFQVSCLWNIIDILSSYG